MAGTPNLTYVGYTCGTNAAQANGTPTAAGFTAAYQATGPGAPAGTGTQYSRCIKYFPSTAEGYAGFPTNWSNLTNLNAIIAAATTTVIPIIVWGSAGAANPGLSAPSAATIQTFLQSLPAGQPCAWNFVSEVEAGTDISASGYVGVVQTFSANLNTALAAQRTATGSGFWIRSNFFYVHAARMDHYSSTSDDTGVPKVDQSYIPPAGTCDCYSADLYRYGPKTQAPASSGARFQGFVQSVQAKVGTNVAFGFSEYGIDGAVFTDAQQASILAQDFAYMTGSSRPGNLPVLFWNYWYQHMASGKIFNFTGPNTVSQWQQMVAYSKSSTGQNTITVTNPGLQTSFVGTAVSLQIGATDSNPALPLTYSLGNTLLPAGLKLNANTGLITGTPTAAGTTMGIVVTVTDGTGASGTSGSFSWRVNSPATETVTMINPLTQTSTRHAPITPLNIQASDSLGLALNYTQLNLPAGLTINSMNGQITGTPTTVSAPTVTITATSPTPVAASQNFTWNIIPSVVTVASPQNQSNVTNDVVSLQMSATDTAPLTVTFTDPGVTLPTGLSISAAGLISGTCTAAGTFNVSITGTDTDGVTGTAAFTWTVAAIVVTVTPPGNVISNTLDVVSLQIVARDSANQLLTYSDGGTLPPGLAITATGATAGLITGEPTTAGIYTVTITATDVSLVTGSATFTWTINQAATVLVISIAPAAGVDVFGNAYPAGLTVGPTGGPGQTTIALDGTLHYSPRGVTIGGMVNGWAKNTAGGGQGLAALDAFGNLIVAFVKLQVGTHADGTLIFPQGSFPPNARPRTTRRVPASTDVMAAAVSPQLEFRTDGSVACYGIGAATRVDCCQYLPLTP